MMSENRNDDGYLALSGIQHYAYCPRQWALIHIEQQWAENALTELGAVMHSRAHDEALREKRGDVIIVRGLAVHSSKLKLYGKCDVVEFHSSEDGFVLAGEKGLWTSLPIEYKRGKPKGHDADGLQLCAQSICLEEMLACRVEYGFLYYGSTRSRERVEMTTELRAAVSSASAEMHRLFDRRHVPAPPKGASCKACSLIELCLPRLRGGKSASAYLVEKLKEYDHEASSQ